MSQQYLEQVPLWVAFPEMLPDDLRSDQGTWYSAVLAWREFWVSLEASEQNDYLDYWSAPPQWREAIQFYFMPDISFDIAQDAKESEKYLERIIPKNSNLPFWKRFFRNRCS